MGNEEKNDRRSSATQTAEVTRGSSIHRFRTALALSALLHGLLAVGLAAILTTAPSVDDLAQLDLSSVELSFAEEESPTSAAQPLSAGTPAESPPPVAPSEPPPHLETERMTMLPPQPEMTSQREPEVIVTQMETPPPPPKASAGESAPAAAPRQAHVDAPPTPVKSIRPDYPKRARERGEYGKVTLTLQISALGTVVGVEVSVSSGFPDLDAAAIKAAWKARFRPARRSGEAVATAASLSLDFRLKGL